MSGRILHGLRGGRQQHYRDDSDVCTLCAAAYADYMRAYRRRRKGHPEYAIRLAALEKLARRHPDEWLDLTAQDTAS